MLFSVRTLKTASQKQHYMCQKFLLLIPIHTWKISWIERLIFFFFAATQGKLELFDSDVVKQRVSRNSVYYFFLVLPSSLAIRSEALEENASVRLFNLTVQKKRTSIQPFDLTVRKKFPSIQPFDSAISKKNLNLFSCLT